MARLIDADMDVNDYIETWDCNCITGGSQTVMAVDDLSYLPTIDAVPVVRCKDCKYIYTIGSYPFVVCSCTHNKGLGDNVKLNDFCSYGERKEE